MTEDELREIEAAYRDSEYLDDEVIGRLLAEVRRLREALEQQP